MTQYNRFKKTSKRNQTQRIEDLPPELRGPAQNKHGGHNTKYICGYRGNTYGPASPVRQFTKEQCAEYEIKMREEGRLT